MKTIGKLVLIASTKIKRIASIQYYCLLLLFFILVSVNILPSGITDVPDSLLSRLNKPRIEEKIEAYTDVMNYCNRVIPLKAIGFGEKALQIARANKYRKGEADILYLLGVCFHSQSN